MAVKCFVLIKSVCYGFLIEVNYLEERAPFSNSHQEAAYLERQREEGVRSKKEFKSWN